MKCIMVFGSRVAPECRTKNILKKMSSFIEENILKRYPDLTYRLWVAISNERLNKYLANRKIVHLEYFNTKVLRGTWKPTVNSNLHHHIQQDNSKVVLLKDHEMITDDVLNGLFQGKYFVTGIDYSIVPVNLKMVKQTCKQFTTFYTENSTNEVTGLSFIDVVISDLDNRSKETQDPLPTIEACIHLHSINNNICIQLLHNAMIYLSKVVPKYYELNARLTCQKNNDHNVINRHIAMHGDILLPDQTFYIMKDKI